MEKEVENLIGQPVVLTQDKLRKFRNFLGKDLFEVFINLLKDMDAINTLVPRFKAMMSHSIMSETLIFKEINMIYKIMDKLDRKIESLIEILKICEEKSGKFTEVYGNIFKDTMEKQRFLTPLGELQGDVEVRYYNMEENLNEGN